MPLITRIADLFPQITAVSLNAHAKMISNKYQSLVTRGIRRAAASAKLRRSCLTLVWTLGKWPRIVTVQKLAAQTLEEKHALQLRTASL